MVPYNEQALRDGGFSDDEIAKDKADKAQTMSAAGFSQPEINQYFGTPPDPDMKPMQAFVQKNLADARSAQPDTGDSSQPKVATTFLDAFKSGLQLSTTGLDIRQKMPDTVTPENAGMAMRLVSHAGTLAGDIPAMIAGGVFGAAAGSEIPVVGNAAGAAAGAFALPAAMRQAYIDHIQKGDIKDFGDFWERTAAVGWEATKGAITGIATEGAGGLAEGALAKTAAPSIVQGGGTVAAELAAMTTVGKGLENQAPKPSDFLEGALLIGGFHAIAHVGELPETAKSIQTKLQNIFADTGLKPAEVGTMALKDPVLKQELVSSGTNTPPSLDPLKEKAQPNQEILPGGKPQMMEAKVPDDLGDPNPALGKGFAAEDNLKVEAPKPVDTGELSDATKARMEAEKTADPDKAALLDRIGVESPKKYPTLSQIYTRTLDSLNPIKQVMDQLSGGKEMPVEDNAYALQRLANASAGKAQDFIEHGPRDFETGEKTGTPGLQQILAPHKGDLDGLEAYMVGRRSIDLEARGVETGVPQDAAQKYVTDNASKYEATFQKIVSFRDETMAYLRDAGVISEKSYDTIKDINPNAIPFKRIVDGEAENQSSRTLNPIKSIHGSDAEIVSPIESIIKETFQRIQIADRNRAALSLVDLANRTEGGSELISRVPTPIKPIELTPKEVERIMTENGIHGSDPDSVTVFRKDTPPLQKDEIAVMRDGKREVYNVGEDVAQAFNKTNEPPNVLMKAISIPAKMIRTGAVETLDFLARHFIRDNTNAFVLSNNGYVPVVDALRGLKEYFTDGKSYQDWMASGGGMSGIADLDKNYIQPKIFELSRDTGLMDKVTNLVKNPLALFRTMAEAITSAPRIGEFMRAQEAGKSLLQSAYEARSVTIDNQRMGSDPSVRAMSLINAFWNTRIQGVDRLVQAFKEDPVRTATKMSLAVTLPSVLLWSQNHEDPRYQDLPDWQKDLFWIVMTKDTIYRIPKPFEGGILFGSSVERMLDSFYAHNPEAFHGFGSALVGGAVPNPIPNAFMPAIEQFANRSWMTGGTIVPHTMEKVAPAYQYNAYTSETAKTLGKMISYVPGVRDIGPGNVTLASPMVIQNYVRAWGGGMGQYAMQIADKGLEAAGIATPPPKPASTLADIPFIKAFVVRYPGESSQSIQNFYDNFQKSETEVATFQKLAKSGDMKAATDYRSSNEAQEHALNLQGIEKSLGVQNQLIQRINANPQMTPNDKRQLIDGIYHQMIQSAQMGNAAMKTFAESLKKQGQ